MGVDDSGAGKMHRAFPQFLGKKGMLLSSKDLTQLFNFAIGSLV